MLSRVLLDHLIIFSIVDAKNIDYYRFYPCWFSICDCPNGADSLLSISFLCLASAVPQSSHLISISGSHHIHQCFPTGTSWMLIATRFPVSACTSVLICTRDNCTFPEFDACVSVNENQRGGTGA